MGQAQKVEGAVSVLRFLASTRFPERDPRRLCRMNTQTKVRTPLWQHGHDPAGICCQLAAHDHVISTAHQEASAFHPWPDLALEPCIQPMMEEYIGHHRGEHSPYKVANFFFGVRIARVRIDPKHDMPLVGGHFHPLHQGTDQCAFACPVCLLSSMMYRSGKVLQATNNQLQFAMLGGFIRQLATLLIDLRDTAAHTEDAWCKRVLVNEALGVTVDQARQTLPQLAEV